MYALTRQFLVQREFLPHPVILGALLGIVWGIQDSQRMIRAAQSLSTLDQYLTRAIAPIKVMYASVFGSCVAVAIVKSARVFRNYFRI